MTPPPPSSHQKDNLQLLTGSERYSRRTGLDLQHVFVNELKKTKKCWCPLLSWADWVCVWQKGLWCCFTFWVRFKKRYMIINPSNEKRWLLKKKKKKTPEQNDWRFFSCYHCFLNFLFVFWCLKLLCVKKKGKKNSCSHFLTMRAV